MVFHMLSIFLVRRNYSCECDLKDSKTEIKTCNICFKANYHKTPIFTNKNIMVRFDYVGQLP